MAQGKGMTQAGLDRILGEIGLEGLLETLGQTLAPTDLQSLLLAVYRIRAARQTPARVLEQYEHNRFVQPAAVDLRARAEVDRLALACADPAFAALDLAPVCPLGTVSVVGPVDQNSAVSTSRNTEVVSDCTNVLALECAVRRRAQRRDPATAGEQVRLCTSHRLLRAQYYNRPGMRAHFQIFALCTAGRAAAGYRFELAALLEQITCYLALLAAVAEIGYQVQEVRVVFTDLPDPAFAERLQEGVITPLTVRFPNAQVVCTPDQRTVASYYELVRFNIVVHDVADGESELADGGFTTWTQQLLSDHKERLLISGIATERICLLPREEAIHHC
ncbi:MAG: hypothetical protein M3Z04_04420 [Chloroflexota bacterium]|nr:hypothetical protein [Chloroflexota bacterium]